MFISFSHPLLYDSIFSHECLLLNKNGSGKFFRFFVSLSVYVWDAQRVHDFVESAVSEAFLIAAA
jgi:hypothetical protein